MLFISSSFKKEEKTTANYISDASYSAGLQKSHVNVFRSFFYNEINKRKKNNFCQNENKYKLNES